MKKIVALFCVLLAGSIVMANEIDSQRLSNDWSKLVDRVCCEYTKGYINSMLSKPGYDSTARTFMEQAAPKLVDKKGVYMNSDQLQSLLVEYGWSATATKLVQPIANRKTLAADKQTLEQLLDISVFSTTMQKYLADAKTELSNQLNTEYEASAEPVKNDEPTAIDSAMAEAEEINMQRSVAHNYDWAIVLLALIAAIEAVALLRLTSRKRIVEVVKESNMMHRTYVRKDDDDIAELRMNMARLQKRLDRIDPEGTPKANENEATEENEPAPLPDVEEAPISFKHL